jgi:hypothetical protein
LSDGYFLCSDCRGFSGEAKSDETHGRALLVKKRRSVSFRRLKSGVLGDIMHKRRGEKIQERKKRRIRGIILRGGYLDHQKSERVNQMTRLDVMEKLCDEQLEVHLIPDVEKGEILIDPRGHGSFQNALNSD